MTFAELALACGIGLALALVVFGVLRLLDKRRPPEPPEDLKSEVHRLCAYLAEDGNAVGEVPRRALKLLEDLLLERAALEQWTLDQRERESR